MPNFNKYLQPGKQSQPTAEILQLAQKWSHPSLDTIPQIIMWIGGRLTNINDENTVLKIFATRTVKQVLDDGFLTGCHDISLVFITICRVLGWPSRYCGGH